MKENGQEALWDIPVKRPSPGRVRKGLDADVDRARSDGHQLPAAGVASLRGLADQLDQLERMLRAPQAKPYDRVPLAQLQKQFDDTYAATFGTSTANANDPLLEALQQFRATEAGHTEGPQPAH